METLRRLRKIDRGVPVYIVTAFHKEFFEGLKSAGEDGLDFEVVKKPIGSDDIVLVAKSVLEGTVVY